MSTAWDRGRLRSIIALSLAALFAACATSGIDTRLLKGAWTTGGPSFDFEIKEHTILIEQDMKEHPYRGLPAV